MDKDFLSQIDRVGDLVPQPREFFADEVLVCECFCVSALDLRSTTKDSCIESALNEAKINLCLGKGCGKCLEQIDSWIDKIF